MHDTAAHGAPATLRDAIGQSRPFDSLEQEAFLALARVASELTAAYADVFREAGVTWTQYNALRILRGAGDEALSCGRIGERMIARDTDVTRLLARLDRQGLVRRERDPRDRRVVTTRITDRGRDVLDALDAPVAARHRELLGHLGPAKLRRLVDLLNEATPRRDTP